MKMEFDVGSFIMQDAIKLGKMNTILIQHQFLFDSVD